MSEKPKGFGAHTSGTTFSAWVTDSCVDTNKVGVMMSKEYHHVRWGPVVSGGEARLRISQMGATLLDGEEATRP